MNDKPEITPTPKGIYIDLPRAEGCQDQQEPTLPAESSTRPRSDIRIEAQRRCDERCRIYEAKYGIKLSEDRREFYYRIILSGLKTRRFIERTEPQYRRDAGNPSAACGNQPRPASDHESTAADNLPD